MDAYSLLGAEKKAIYYHFDSSIIYDDCMLFVLGYEPSSIRI